MGPYTISLLVKAKMNAITGGLDKKQGFVGLWYLYSAFFFLFFPYGMLNDLF
jgi:hypothetical protein